MSCCHCLGTYLCAVPVPADQALGTLTSSATSQLGVSDSTLSQSHSNPFGLMLRQKEPCALSCIQAPIPEAARCPLLFFPECVFCQMVKQLSLILFSVDQDRFLGDVPAPANQGIC